MPDTDEEEYGGISTTGTRRKMKMNPVKRKNTLKTRR
jgi:hypothetical protein